MAVKNSPRLCEALKIAERLRAGQPREAVIAAWGIGEDGRKVLLHLIAGSKEDTETVRAFFQDMRMRGFGDPLLVVSDGAPGVIRAIEECFPRSARQRCLAHRMRNLAVKFQPICGPSSRRGWRPAIRCRHERSRPISPTASVLNTQPRCHPRSPASRTISKPALRICGCR
jgi:transposase-like protein